MVEEQETAKPVPTDRWDAEAIAAGLPDRMARRMRLGGFLEGDLGAFDAQAFGLSGTEANWLDPQHRLLLMVAWEACENAGMPMAPSSQAQAAVFAQALERSGGAVNRWG
ncbi:hypothetical protein OG422_15280 [Streptomyces sp. NBC_01525]|uniref:beta-ketoacyl synthase N-terminal-like domain-containing protein n=1 Tax=Streptomyces sp. NBC_01525 TaxID=2903893 RepID=UPI0038641390